MKVIATTLQDKIILVGTVFSGLMFVVCATLMLTNYRPLFGDAAGIQDVNGAFIREMKSGYVSVKTQIMSLPEIVANSVAFDEIALPSSDLSGAVHYLVKIGGNLLVLGR